MTITLQQRQKAWTVLTEAPDQARAAAKTTTTKIEEIRANENWSDKHKAEQIAKLQEDLDRQLATIRKDADDARDVLAAAAEELAQPQGDTNTQLLHETRTGRAWARVRPQLEAGRSHREILKEAADRRDHATLTALAAELPAYLEAARTRPGGLAGRATQPLDMAGVRREIDIATARGLGDDKGFGTAARLRLHAASAHPVVHTVVDHVRGGGGNLTTAFRVKYAQQEAEATTAALAGDGDSGSDAA
ncbi:hypothetical protein [Actinoplanes sp. NPDC049316]|uniref:hypothetical protein n=1 Tax=Actinoplanes sp. NPDC049316 TaxID=3154727 RepID=UPI00343B8C90